MSAEAMTWAKGQDVSSPGAKLLLVVLADSADSQGRCLEPKRNLAQWTSSAPNTVQANLRRLEEASLIDREYRSRSDGGQDVTLVKLLLDSPRRVADTPPAESAADTPPVGSPLTRVRNTDPPTTSVSQSGRLTFPLDIEVENGVGRDAEEFLRRKTKVATRLVQPEEMVKAAAVMSAFNREAGTDQGLGPNLTPIVGRIREHPSWDAAKFVRLVESAFRVRWWERSGRRRPGPPTPKVIFGSTDCFVNVANDAADERAGKAEKIEERRGRFDRDVVRDA